MIEFSTCNDIVIYPIFLVLSLLLYSLTMNLLVLLGVLRRVCRNVLAVDEDQRHANCSGGRHGPRPGKLTFLTWRVIQSGNTGAGNRGCRP